MLRNFVALMKFFVKTLLKDLNLKRNIIHTFLTCFYIINNIIVALKARQNSFNHTKISFFPRNCPEGRQCIYISLFEQNNWLPTDAQSGRDLKGGMSLELYPLRLDSIISNSTSSQLFLVETSCKLRFCSLNVWFKTLRRLKVGHLIIMTFLLLSHCNKLGPFCFCYSIITEGFFKIWQKYASKKIWEYHVRQISFIFK